MAHGLIAKPCHVWERLSVIVSALFKIKQTSDKQWRVPLKVLKNTQTVVGNNSVTLWQRNVCSSTYNSLLVFSSAQTSLVWALIIYLPPSLSLSLSLSLFISLSINISLSHDIQIIQSTLSLSLSFHIFSNVIYFYLSFSMFVYICVSVCFVRVFYFNIYIYMYI